MMVILRMCLLVTVILYLAWLYLLGLKVVPWSDPIFGIGFGLSLVLTFISWQQIIDYIVERSK